MHSYAYPSVFRPPADMALRSNIGAVERLDGNGFTLDPVHAGDAERLATLSQDEKFRRWLPWIRGGFTTERAREFAEDFSRKNWASGQPVWAVRIEGVLMGVVDLRDRGEGAWEIGFWMHPDARGKGLMTAACALVVQAAFDSLGALRILHFARVGNVRSLRIARNLGFSPEGVRRKPTPSGVERQWQSALLRSDWERRGSVAHVGVPTPDVLDGGRPRELVAEKMGGDGGSGPPLYLDADAVTVAEMAAHAIFGIYGIAEEVGGDLGAALARVHRRNLEAQTQR